jgi:hypothetical protein
MRATARRLAVGVLLAAHEGRSPDLALVALAIEALTLTEDGPFVVIPGLAPGERFEVSTGVVVYSAAFLEEDTARV